MFLWISRYYECSEILSYSSAVNHLMEINLNLFRESRSRFSICHKFLYLSESDLVKPFFFLNERSSNNKNAIFCLPHLFDSFLVSLSRQTKRVVMSFTRNIISFCREKDICLYITFHCGRNEMKFHFESGH